MRKKPTLEFENGNAICYSGYRTGQSPDKQLFPTYDEIKEDLVLLDSHFKYIRLYDSGIHAETVLNVIEQEKLHLKVMLGICLGAEISNDKCPWGGIYSPKQLLVNKQNNEKQIHRLGELAIIYESIVFAVSVGNEATVEWTDHLVPVDSVINYTRYLKNIIRQPLTFCENYVPWQSNLDELVKELDFISLHTYPIWEYSTIEDAIHITKENYFSVKEKYPHKTIVITEAGWTTKSNGSAIPISNATIEFQQKYLKDLIQWSRQENILTFIFEAFDEDWKGSSDILEPEKHWGIFTIDRKEKFSIVDLLN